MAILEIKDLQVSYGLIKAIKGVSFNVNEGEIVSLIGANGAGKTTILHSISGLIPKQSGHVIYNGEDITSVHAHSIVGKGLSQVPEGRRIFQELTVYENIELGFYLGKDKAKYNSILEKIYTYFPILKERSKQIAGTLSGGELQMLAISRALMSDPKVLLLDEPSMGLSPLYVKTIFDIIREINKSGTTVLLVEQNAKKALSISDRAYVLEIGKITMTGTGQQLLNDENVRKAYLGG